MGLDMYLEERKKGEKDFQELMYWRKANQIHKWFVDVVQDGKDDCKSYEVPYEDLLALRALCGSVLEAKKLPEDEREDACMLLLPPQTGFFFGGVTYDEWYFKDVENTYNALKEISKDSEYVYASSW